MATEAEVSRAIVMGLRRAGHHAWKASDKFTVGVSDILGVFSALPALVHPEVGRERHTFVGGGRAIAIETKLVKAFPAREASKILSHPLKRAQRAFLEDVCDRGGLAYVAIATPRGDGRAGVDVWLVPPDAWLHAPRKRGEDGGNLTLGAWKALITRPDVHRMSGSLSKGYLPDGGPLEAVAL